jgi:hypothetical protein
MTSSHECRVEQLEPAIAWDIPVGPCRCVVTAEPVHSLLLLKAAWRRRERPWGGPPSRGRSPFGGHLGGQRPTALPVAAGHRRGRAGRSGALGRRRSSRSGRAGVPADPRRPGPRPSGSARSARRSTARSIVWKWPRRHGPQCSRGAAHERPAAWPDQRRPGSRRAGLEGVEKLSHELEDHVALARVMLDRSVSADGFYCLGLVCLCCGLAVRPGRPAVLWELSVVEQRCP